VGGLKPWPMAILIHLDTVTGVQTMDDNDQRRSWLAKARHLYSVRGRAWHPTL
jgi:hypothetical protein